MKTAMQELIDMAGILPLKTFHVWLGENYERLLEKEKNLMFHSFYGGVGFDESLDDCETLFEQYYKETYNQNK
jgi:hypothetical protein